MKSVVLSNFKLFKLATTTLSDKYLPKTFIKSADASGSACAALATGTESETTGVDTGGNETGADCEYFLLILSDYLLLLI